MINILCKLILFVAVHRFIICHNNMDIHFQSKIIIKIKSTFYQLLL